MLSTLKTLKFNPSYKNNENGFTLVELTIVVLVLSILAAITIPLFANQQKNSIEATIKTDLRNAALVLRTESTKTFGRTLTYIPNFSTTSPDNRVALDKNMSNSFYFCLVGTNPTIPNSVFYYSSLEGKVTTTPCPPLPNSNSTPTQPSNSSTNPQDNFTVQEQTKLANKKVLIANNPNVSSIQKASLTNFLTAQGYGTIDEITNTQLVNLDQNEINKYDVLVLQNNFWGSPEQAKSKLLSFYDQGGKIIIEGNDNGISQSPFITNSIYVSNTNAAYIPTNQQGLNPPFPYTFAAIAFNSDLNWSCIQTLNSGAIPIAVTKYSDRTCITIFANSNNNGGQLVSITTFGSFDTGPTSAVFAWIAAG